MIQIKTDTCIGCGMCVNDCFPAALRLERQKAVLAQPENCLACGHCIAVCPKAAVTDDALDMREALPITRGLEGDRLLGLMRSRRSCRHYTPEPVSEEALNTLLNAARVCPTAKNLQATRYIAVSAKKEALLDAALSALGKLGEQQIQTADTYDERRRAENFIRWSRERSLDNTFDPLFFHAPMLLLFVATRETALDAASAAAYTELMAASLGLGCLYSGYFVACAAMSSEIRGILELGPEERVVRCLVLGWPDIRFQRTAPRKPANLTYK